MAIERAMIFAAKEEIESVDLANTVRAATPRDPEYSPDLRQASAELERAHILRVIEQCGGNKRKEAKLFGLGVTSLYRKLGASSTGADGV